MLFSPPEPANMKIPISAVYIECQNIFNIMIIKTNQCIINIFDNTINLMQYQRMRNLLTGFTMHAI